MSDPSLFKWRHFQADIILCAVRWYLCYSPSYRDRVIERLFGVAA
jgi:IS6 family transposase